MSKWAILLSFYLVGFATSGWSSEIFCEHYWTTKAGVVRSVDVAVGRDVGQSKAGPDGEYRCSVTLTKNDVLQGKYLYLGEIGDASYVELVSGPEGLYRNRLPINHGLSPNSADRPRYERFIPFIIPVRDLYQADGVHRFVIHYRDLVPTQSGLRSGPPSLELVGGTVKRFLRNAPGLTYHLAQALILALLAFVVWSWRTTTIRRRAKFFFALISSSSVIVSISALPRYCFNDPNDAIRLNDYVNIFGFGLALLPFTEFIQAALARGIFFAWSSIAVTLCIALSRMSLETSIYTWLYCGFVLLEAGIAPLFIGIALRQNILQTTLSARPTTRVMWAMFAISGLMTWDILVNVFIYNFSDYFLSHYLYFPLCFGILMQLQHEEPVERGKFLDGLQNLTTDGTRQVVADAGRSFTLNLYAERLGDLIEAQRIGLQVVKNGRAWFLGFFGRYANPGQENEVRPGSASQRVLDCGQIIVEDTRNTETGQPTTLVVVPLRQGPQIIGLLSITNFRYGFISPFIANQLSTIQEHCQLLFANLSLTINLRETVTILEMGRLRVPKIQLESEDYFRSNFNVSRTMRAPAFIMGDLVGSVRLRSEFNEAVTQAIDQRLRYVWETFRHLGITVTREKGDFITILAQNLDTDKTEFDAALRCLEIFRFFSTPPASYSDIPRKLGITLDFQFRIAMSQIEKPGEISASPQFISLSDTQIDCAARVINEIATGGECILLDHVYDQLPDALRADLTVLPPHRIRGVDKMVRLYKLRNQTRKAA